MRNPICYIGGSSFKNIFGGVTAAHFGSVSHIINHTSATKKWPYLFKSFYYTEASGFGQHFKTWEQCKHYIKDRHPAALFEIYWEEFNESFPDAKIIEVTE